MHSCQRIYKLHSPLHSLSNTHTHTLCVCVPKNVPKNTNTNIYAYTYTDACRKHSSTHSHRVESQDPEMCSHLHYLKIDKRGRQQTIIPRAQGGGNKKKKDRRLRKQIEVMSSELNGKPCVRKTGESIHIYCCQDFNINIIESTSDVSLSADWLTKTSTSCRLYLRKIKI